MASPLTRMRVSSTGGLYTRPPLVEAEIDHVMTFPPAERRRRGKVQDRTSGDYLRSETLVHLLRADLRQGGDGTPYLQALIKRCEGNLRATISAQVPQVAQLRQEILQQFGLLFAEEVAHGGDELDFFECQFNSAFKALRVNAFNRHMVQAHREASAPLEPDGDEELNVAAEGAALDVWGRLQSEDAVFLREVAKFIMTFPPAERHAIGLCRIKGMTQKEAALALGVDERTIRNLLKRADEKLARIKENGR
ncbi:MULTISPECIES: sigma-70 family RNA polymerase sigma factor [unclassified Devosia]|uniref:sigma-70 family RNA polymerase sigma factor n=1 Tax=unclassified Devosia TaxID=196773 RepID=UPI001AC227B7|nr:MULTISPECIES: sigma-70 family RNA polymerase sigma factor [unclassified Devosia]MBN9360882.1 sigma-70 family RNA polymerase sigma factor [Devosia sp.]